MWFNIHQLASHLYRIQEPGHVSFFLIKIDERAILLDSGLGIARRDFEKVLSDLSVKRFRVLSTHLHCDHAGFNFLAEKVYVSRTEFEKYQAISDEKQILNYHNLLKNYKSWPEEQITETADFSEKVEFIEENTLTVFDQKFEVIKSPGHTSGHLCFISHEHQSIFLGDLIYNGMLYLNLPDSHFGDYIKSLETILHLAEKNQYSLLPCHNSIPLDIQYVRGAYEACLKIQKKMSTPVHSLEANSIFKACDEYHIEDIKIQISRTK